MNTITAQEIKRRGISAVDSISDRGPVYVIKNNKPDYVIMTVDDYNTYMDELTLSRVAASDADLTAGRIKSGDASDLMQKILSE